MLPVLAPVNTGPKNAVPGAEQPANKIKQIKNKKFFNIKIYQADT